jgi:RNA polymerase sigma-70 factor (ECF subfamily)
VLVDRFSPRLFSFLVRRVGCREDAADLTQETFVRAWRRLETYKPHLRFSTWLFTIAVRLAAAHHRRRRRGAALAGDSSDDRAIGVSDRAEAGEQRSRLWRVAEETLTPDQFSAVWLRYAEDETVEGIARILGKSRVGVRVTLFRAREKLGRCLRTFDGDRVPPAPAAEVRVRATRERVGGTVRC